MLLAGGGAPNDDIDQRSKHFAQSCMLNVSSQYGFAFDSIVVECQVPHIINGASDQERLTPILEFEQAAFV